MRAFLLPALLAPALALTPAITGVRPQVEAVTDPVILATGSVLLTSKLEDGQLVTRVKDENPAGEPRYRAVEDAVVHVADAARRPADPGVAAFLGHAEAWIVPQEGPELQLGWAAEELPGGEAVTWSLQAADGPGAVALYRTGAAGPEVLWNSGDGVSAADSFQFADQAHGNWAFTAPGIYCLQFTRATALGGQTQSVHSTLAVAVATDPAGVTGRHCAPTPRATPTEPAPAPSPEQPSAEPTQAPSSTPTPNPTAGPTPRPSGTPTATATPKPRPSTSPTATPKPRPSATPTRRPSPLPTPWRPVPNRSVNARGATILNNGHIDVASLLTSGRLQTVIKDTTQGGEPRWLSPARTVLQVLPAARQRVPAKAAAELQLRNDTVYLLPQTQKAGLLWPGWSTEHIADGATPGGVAWALTEVRGPGQFVMFETGPFGEAKALLSSLDGVNANDRIVIPERTHAHGNWAFTAPGVYCLGMARSARTANGQVVSDSFYLQVAVGEIDVTHLDPQSCARPATPAPPRQPQPGRPNQPGGGGKPNHPGTPGAPSNPGGGARPPIFQQPSLPPPPPPAPPRPRGPRGPVGRPSGPVGAPSSCQVQLPILEAGHIDYATQLNGGQLQSVIGDDTSGSKVYREPSKVVLWLKPSARVQLPSGFSQVGTPGEAIWQIPQTQKPDLIWLGWSTESLTSGSASGPVEWTINSVDGPGRLTVYLTGAFGGVQEVVFAGPGSYRIPLGVHAHANWAFSAEGVYRINATQTVTLPSGQRASDTETMTIVVGNTDPHSVATVHDCAAASSPGGATSARAAGLPGLPPLPTNADGFKAAPQAHALAAGAAPAVAAQAPAGVARPYVREALAEVLAAQAKPAAAPARAVGARQDERLIAHLLIILGGALSAGSVTLSVLRRRLR